MTADAALADTSLCTGLEQRRFPSARMPSVLPVSVITAAELRLGVLAAQTTQDRAARLRTLGDATALDPLPVDDPVADARAELRIALRDAGLKIPVNDSRIAATAIAHELPVATQDDDFDGAPGVQIIKLKPRLLPGHRPSLRQACSVRRRGRPPRGRVVNVRLGVVLIGGPAPRLSASPP